MDFKLLLLGTLMVLLLVVEESSAKRNWADFYAKKFKLGGNAINKSPTQSRRVSRIGQIYKRDMGGSRVTRRIQPRAPVTVEVAGHELPNLEQHLKKPWSTTSRERTMWPKHIKLELASRPWQMKRYQSPQSLGYRPWSNVNDNTWHKTQIKRLQDGNIVQPLFEIKPAYRSQPSIIKRPQILPKPSELRLPLIQSEISYQERPATEFISKPLPQIQDETITDLPEEEGILTLVDESTENKHTGTNETKLFEFMHENIGEKTIVSSTIVERKHTDQGLLASILVEEPNNKNSTMITAEAAELRLHPSQGDSPVVQAASRPEPLVYSLEPRKPVILPPPQALDANIRPQSEYQYLERLPEEFQERPIYIQSTSTLAPDSLELVTQFEEHVGDEMVKTKMFEYTNGGIKETKIISSVSATNTHVDHGLVAKVIVENPPLPLVKNSSDNSVSLDAQPALRPDNLILRVPQILSPPQEISKPETTSEPLYLEGPKPDFVVLPDMSREPIPDEPKTLQLIETIDDDGNKTQLFEFDNESNLDDRIIISSTSIEKANNNQGLLSKIIINKPAIPLVLENNPGNIEASHLSYPENTEIEDSQPGYAQGAITYESRNMEFQPLAQFITSQKPKFRYAAQRPEEFAPKPETSDGNIENNNSGLKLVETFDQDNGNNMNTTNLFEYNNGNKDERMVISSFSVNRPDLNQGVMASILIHNDTLENELENNVDEPNFINMPTGIQSLPQPELRRLPNDRPSQPTDYLIQSPTEYISLESIQNMNNQNIIKAAESKLLESTSHSKPVYLLGIPTAHQPLNGNKEDNTATERSTKPFSYVGHSYEGDIISKNTHEDPHISSGFIDIMNDPLPLVETNPLLGNIAAAYRNPGQLFAETYHVQVHEVDELP